MPQADVGRTGIIERTSDRSDLIRILFTIPNFDTAGSGRALLNLANGLDRNIFEPHILCRHDRGDFFEVVKGSGIPVHVFDFTSPMRPIIGGVRMCWETSRKLRKIGPDIIHSFNYSADYSEGLAVRLAGKRWIYTKKNMNWGGSSKNAWHLRTLLANRIVVQNTEMTDRFFARSQSKTILIPRGVDTKTFKPVDRNGSGSFVLPTVICVANLVPVKGVEVLIEAFKSLCDIERYKGWRLKVVGDDRNEYGIKLKQTYKGLIESGRLVFTGKCDDVKSHLASSEIFVLPTLNEGRMEGSPVSLLEAMSMGLIVVGSRVPGITDQLRTLGDDHLFQPGNVPVLRSKLLEFMDMSSMERKRLQNRIREYCTSNWGIETEIGKHQKLYLDLMSRG